MRMSVLSLRSLNRATLERQLLLCQVDRSALDVVGHLVGLQAQDPDPPYVGLWSRIAAFRHDELTQLLHQRQLVRATLFRGTQHLVTADDYRWLRPLLQPMLDRWQKGAFGRSTAGIDLTELASAAREILAQGLLNRAQLGRALVRRWPGHDPVALAQSTQGLLPVLHPPPTGTWGYYGPTPFVLADQWLDQPLANNPPVENVVLRYLAAFGPATVKDIQAWSGMTRLREVVEPLRSQLRVFRSEDGAELFDHPGAPRPDPDTPAPVRFLASLDNVVLAYADRSRMMTGEQRRYVGFEAAMTVDGFVRGLWRVRQDKGRSTAVLAVRLFTPLSGQDGEAVVEEGLRLLRFAAAGADHHDVRLSSVDDDR